MKIDSKELVIWMFAKFQQIQEEYEINIDDMAELSNLEVQKLLYFINGFFYAKFDKKLIEEKFEAWTYGPVIPEIYKWLKHAKNQKLKINIENENENEYFQIFSKFSKNFTDEEKEFIQKIFNFYSRFSAYQLVNLSHEGPWVLTKKNEEIKDELIKEYFRKELWKNQQYF